MKYENSKYLDLAIKEALLAGERGEVPIGAVIVDPRTDTVISKAGNMTEQNKDPTAHAELIAIREATKIICSPRIECLALYVTLEPCPMCAAAISFARIKHLYFGAFDPKGGGVEHGPRIFEQPSCHHTPQVYGGIQETRCSTILKNFFLEKR